MYATKQQAGGAWGFDTLHTYVVMVSDDYLGFRGTSLALDSRGYPRIAYAAERKSEVAYASYDGSSWSGTKIGCLEWAMWATACGLPSLALDARDRPHISFFKDSADPPSESGFIAYAGMNGTGWDLEYVHSSWLTYSSIMTDRDSKAQIFYAPDWYLHHTEVGPNMTTEVVDPQYRVEDFYPDGAMIDRSGGYHVAYSHIDQGAPFAWIRYAHKWGRLNITIHRIFGDGGGFQTSSQMSGMGHIMDCVSICSSARFEPEAVYVKIVQFDGFRSD
jgi:hypothetical protein